MTGNGTATELLPLPLSPPNCDLRGYDFMPLYGHRLFGSALYTESTDAEFRAALRLWWSAWNQVPAGSLPNSDRALATLADYGRDLTGWAKVKGRALHGFVLCDDGRLYHPMLCEEAVSSFEKRLRSNARRNADKARLQAWRETRKAGDGNANGNATGNGHDTASETPDETPDETPVKRVSKCVDSDRDSDKERGKLTLSNGRVPRAVRMTIPPWMPPEAWNGYVEMRKRARKPPTERAVSMLIAKLDDFRQRGIDVAASLDQSTISGWTDVYEPKDPAPRRSSANGAGKLDIYAELAQSRGYHQ